MGLDLVEIRAQTLLIRELLLEQGYRIQTVLLFGSQAKGTATEQSDIDLAFVSIDFGKDPFAESVAVNKLLFGRIAMAEAVAIPLAHYLDVLPLSPIAWEVKKTGLPLF